MRDLSGLMMVYGVAMLFIGTSMYAGITSMTQGALFPSLGMIVVGALMIVNSVMMCRPRMEVVEAGRVLFPWNKLPALLRRGLLVPPKGVSMRRRGE